MFTSSLVNFASVIVIIVFFNDWMCTLHSELLQVSVDCMHAHHEFVSDATRFPATSTMAEGDQGHLHFPSLLEDRRKWPEWLATISRISLANIITVRNAEQHQERISYFALFAFGRFWDVNQHIWPAEEADIARLTADAIIEHCPAMPVLVRLQLRLEAAQYHFVNRQVHLQMQVRFRQTLCNLSKDIPYLLS